MLRRRDRSARPSSGSMRRATGSRASASPAVRNGSVLVEWAIRRKEVRKASSLISGEDAPLGRSWRGHFPSVKFGDRGRSQDKAEATWIDERRSRPSKDSGTGCPSSARRSAASIISRNFPRLSQLALCLSTGKGVKTPVASESRNKLRDYQAQTQQSCHEGPFGVLSGRSFLKSRASQKL